MTAHYLATVVEKCFNAVDFDAIIEGWKDIPRTDGYYRSDEWANTQMDDPAYLKWCRACNLLDVYLRRNRDTFIETEMVYKWAKKHCDARNDYRSRDRALMIPGKRYYL